MKNILDTQFDKSTIPNRSEIRSYCKMKLLQDNCIEYLPKLTSTLLRNSEIWVLGYVVGVASDNFQSPLDKDSVKDFYLESIYLKYIKPILIG